MCSKQGRFLLKVIAPFSIKNETVVWLYIDHCYWISNVDTHSHTTASSQNCGTQTEGDVFTQRCRRRSVVGFDRSWSGWHKLEQKATFILTFSLCFFFAWLLDVIAFVSISLLVGLTMYWHRAQADMGLKAWICWTNLVATSAQGVAKSLEKMVTFNNGHRI